MGDLPICKLPVPHLTIMSTVLPSIVAMVLYALSTVLLTAPLTGCPYTWHRSGLITAMLAIFLHTGVLLGAHGLHLDLHFFAALSLVSCVVALLTLLVNLLRPVTGLSLLVFPLAALLLALDVFVASPTLPQSMDWQISLHATIALLSYSLLSIATLVAILLAIQERALRSHRLGRLLQALPPLTQTETLLFRLVRTGFIGLSLTLLTGTLFITDTHVEQLTYMIALSVLAWLIFAALLWGHWRHGWRGARAVQLTLLGMTALALAFFGSKLVLELLHRRIP